MLAQTTEFRHQNGNTDVHTESLIAGEPAKDCVLINGGKPASGPSGGSGDTALAPVAPAARLELSLQELNDSKMLFMSSS